MPFTVKIIRKDGAETTVKGITEIHYNYPPQLDSRGPMIAFESEVFFTGFTLPMSAVQEFEAIYENLTGAVQVMNSRPGHFNCRPGCPTNHP